MSGDEKESLGALRLELEKQRFEFEKREAQRGWSKPLNVAIVGGFAALIGVVVTESQNSRRAFELESMRAESARILQMLSATDQDQAAENLAFLLRLGLVTDPSISAGLQAFLDDRGQGQGPVVSVGVIPDPVLRGPSCLIRASRSSVRPNEEFTISWFGVGESDAEWWINGDKVDPHDAAEYSLTEGFEYLRFTMYGEDENGDCGDSVTVRREPGCEISVNKGTASLGEEYTVSWNVVGNSRTAWINGTEVSNQGTADFTFNGPNYDRFRLVADFETHQCDVIASVLSSNPEEIEAESVNAD